MLKADTIKIERFTYLRLHWTAASVHAVLHIHFLHANSIDKLARQNIYIAERKSTWEIVYLAVNQGPVFSVFLFPLKSSLCKAHILQNGLPEHLALSFERF